MTSALFTAVSRYGFAAIALLMAGESCGLPIPSEVVVPLGGWFASLGHLNLVGVVAASTLGNLVGSLVAYWLAARWGNSLLLGPGRYVGIRRHHVELADRWFQRHGLIAVLVGRMLPVVRTYISFPAGLARVPLGRFALFTVVGAIPWNTALALAGYFLGREYDRIAVLIQDGGYVFVVVIAIVVVVWWVRGRREDATA